MTTPSVKRIASQWFGEQAGEALDELGVVGEGLGLARAAIRRSILLRASHGDLSSLKSYRREAERNELDYSLIERWLGVEASYEATEDYSPFPWFVPVVWEIGAIAIPLAISPFQSLSILQMVAKESERTLLDGGPHHTVYAWPLVDGRVLVGTGNPPPDVAPLEAPETYSCVIVEAQAASTTIEPLLRSIRTSR